MLYEGDSKFEFLALLHKWNEEVAQEHVANKTKTSYFRMEYGLSDDNEVLEDCITLSEEQVSKYRAFQEMCRQKFIVDFPDAFDENGTPKADTWNKYLHECYSTANFVETLENGESAHVRFVDLDHPFHLYRFSINFLDGKSIVESVPVFVKITEQQYSSLLVKYLEGGNHWAVLTNSPHRNVFNDIMAKSPKRKDGYGSSIGLDELKEDAEEILATKGENRPRHDRSPKWGIIRWI